MNNSQSGSLQRFLDAQECDYEQALGELRRGHKQTHWVWYILPQLRGLGQSVISHEYGISGRQEAEAYLAHPVLGARLKECVNAILVHRGARAEEILGHIDALKFRSCLTLFSAAAPEERCFKEALAVFYEGQPDWQTLLLLEEAGG